MYSSTHSLISALDGGEWSASRPSLFTPRERAPGTHWIGNWAGSRASLDAMVKRKIHSPRRESNPRTPIVQPVAQGHTDWAITVLGTRLYEQQKLTQFVFRDILVSFPLWQGFLLLATIWIDFRPYSLDHKIYRIETDYLLIQVTFCCDEVCS
jgi:hypothetical protein